VLFSYPCGRLCDIIGRKTSLLFSSLISGTGIILFATFTSFGGLAISYMVWGLGVALNVSALESIVYDLSTMYNQKYLQLYGLINFVGAISLGVSSAIGGLIGQFIGFKFVIILSGGLVFVSTIFTLNMEEPIKKIVRKREKLKMRLFLKNRNIQGLFILRIILLLDIDILFIFKQPYLYNIGFSTFFIGIFYMFDTFARGIASMYSSKFAAIIKVGKQTIFISSILMFLTTLLPGIFDFDAIILFFIINSVLFGFYSTILSDETNKMLPMEIRGTVLSMIALISSFVTAVTEPIFGYIATVYNISIALISLSIVFLVFAMIGLQRLES
jgi:MFS family permease